MLDELEDSRRETGRGWGTSLWRLTNSRNDPREYARRV